MTRMGSVIGLHHLPLPSLMQWVPSLVPNGAEGNWRRSNCPPLRPKGAEMDGVR